MTDAGIIAAEFFQDENCFQHAHVTAGIFFRKVDANKAQFGGLLPDLFWKNTAFFEFISQFFIELAFGKPFGSLLNLFL